MTKGEAKRVAHRIAYIYLQRAIDVGGSEFEQYLNATEKDQLKIDKALDELSQRHFELSDKK